MQIAVPKTVAAATISYSTEEFRFIAETFEPQSATPFVPAVGLAEFGTISDGADRVAPRGSTPALPEFDRPRPDRGMGGSFQVGHPRDQRGNLYAC